MAKKYSEGNKQLELASNSLEQKKNLPDFSKEKSNKHTVDVQLENGYLQNVRTAFSPIISPVFCGFLVTYCSEGSKHRARHFTDR